MISHLLVAKQGRLCAPALFAPPYAPRPTPSRDQTPLSIPSRAHPTPECRVPLFIEFGRQPTTLSHGPLRKVHGLKTRDEFPNTERNKCPLSLSTTKTFTGAMYLGGVDGPGWLCGKVNPVDQHQDKKRVRSHHTGQRSSLGLS